jgi:Xaa-Pro aminopeptidase
LAKPGIKISDLDKKARQVLAEYGLEKYFTHALGH